MDCDTRLIVKWGGKEYAIELLGNETVAELKEIIQNKTGVKPERQKLLNLKCKGKEAEEQCQVSSLKLKQGFKIMMMGSLEEDIADVNCLPIDLPEIENDLDLKEESIAIENKDIYLSKIARRIKEYKINVLNNFREGKHLLVLDIDYTLFDHRSPAENALELMRPYLHEFLTSAYERYDIVIWSATQMKWIEQKLRLLGVSTHSDYKIAFYLDSLAMISVQVEKYGLVEVKPLGVIWGKYPQFTSKNTIMFDDVRKNFLMNPKNGLKIRPFRQAHFNREKDNELLKLARYLQLLAEHCTDFSSVKHKNWEKYKQ